MGAEGGTFEGVTPGFLRTSPSIVPIGPHVGFPRMLLTRVLTDRPQKQSGVIFSFPNEKSPPMLPLVKII